MPRTEGCICSAFMTFMKTNVKIDVRKKKEPCLRGGGRNSRDMRWRAAARGSEKERSSVSSGLRAFSCLSDLAGGPQVSGTAMRRGLGNKSIEQRKTAKKSYWMS